MLLMILKVWGFLSICCVTINWETISFQPVGWKLLLTISLIWWFFLSNFASPIIEESFLYTIIRLGFRVDDSVAEKKFCLLAALSKFREKSLSKRWSQRQFLRFHYTEFCLANCRIANEESWIFNYWVKTSDNDSKVFTFFVYLVQFQKKWI